MKCPSDVDCDAGRRLGCQTFCCRLLVRLDPDEQVPTGEPGTPPKGFVDKDEQGYCVHFDRERSLCRIWQQRPRICREYSCNGDPLLQVVLREGFVNIAQLAIAESKAYIPRETHIHVPCHHEANKKPNHS
ncbi:MAG: YkgJ family cysteine cluster protein [Acidiferrobacteraceae bacterium]|jgi:hypothetical protein